MKVGKKEDNAHGVLGDFCEREKQERKEFKDITYIHLYCSALFYIRKRTAVSACRAPCSRSWSISDDSLRRYVHFASESCIQGCYQLQTVTGLEMEMMDGNYQYSITELRYLNDGLAPLTHSGVAGYSDQSLHNNSLQWPMLLMLQRYIKDVEDNLSIIRLRYGESSKSLFRNREFIVYERRETMDDGTLVVAVASLPREIAAGLHPKQNNVIRGLLLQSGWVVDKLENDSCIVTYVAQEIKAYNP